MPQSFDTAGRLHGATRSHDLRLRVADSFTTRLRGLMFSAPLAADAGLLILDCPSVHCAFMRQAIDVVYLDAGGAVLKCVPGLKPWRASVSNVGRDARGRPYPRARHTLELADGSIARLGIATGDVLVHPALAGAGKRVPPSPGRAQRGASMVEFVVVGPILTLIGLALLQYGLLFFAKNQINHAGFLAARAGSTGNASMNAIRKSYAVALAPLYGGGKTAEELLQAQAMAAADVAANVRIEMLNPTKESFATFNSPALQAKLTNSTKRVIPNSHQETHGEAPDPLSGQTIQDANLLKLRITHGYKMTVPIVSGIYRAYLKWLDPKTDAFHTQLLAQGRVPVVSDVTLEMQSDAIEGETISMPGQGNGGNPQNPGTETPPAGNPPVCDTFQNCGDSTVPGGGGTPGGSDPGDGGYCPVPVQTQLSTDTLFEFGKSKLLPAGIEALDQLIAAAKQQNIKSADIVGYTDQIGDEASNLTLSQQRAQAVRDYLSSHGFPNVPMNVVGKGEADPKVSETACAGQDKVSCLAPNRRVVVTLNK